MKFIEFWFEANQTWGRMSSLEEWKKALKIYAEFNKSGTDLMKMAHATIETEKVESGTEKEADGYLPNFGLYITEEHASQMTLEDWAKKNNMYDILV
ncbi:hypothetical protein KAS31_04150 [Candidatus Parcubacteria bacterium]|nr:hypothetical protein [Candidatus Parcubacteria bacterium]